MLKNIYQADLLFKSKMIKMLIGAITVQGLVTLVLVFFILDKNQNIRVYPIPPGISTENAVSSGFYVEGDEIGSAYLEKMGVYISQQLLNYQPARANAQFNRVLFDLEPELAAKLKPRLMADVTRIRKNSISSVFQSSDVWVEKNTFYVTGELSIFYSNKLIQRGMKTFRVEFGVVGGRVVVKRYDQVEGTKGKQRVKSQDDDVIPAVNSQDEKDPESEEESQTHDERKNNEVHDE